MIWILVRVFIFKIIIIISARDWTQVLVHASHLLYHWATPMDQWDFSSQVFKERKCPT